jgi:hypothetical protein
MTITPQHYFGGGGQTDLQPLTLAFVAIVGILLFVLPKRYAYLPLIGASVLISLDEQLIIGGIHLTMSRLVLVFAWIRLLIVKNRTGRSFINRWTSFDTVFVAYSICNVVTFILLWGAESGAIINRLGFLFNAWGMYFLLRFYLRDSDDLLRATRTLVWVFALIAVGMTTEMNTGRNYFSILGGVAPMSSLRAGKVRAQGPFQHPITAGTIGTCLVPLCVGAYWVNKRNRRIAVVGVASAVAVAVSARSSTAMMTIVAAAFGLLFWRYRRNLRLLRWSVVVILVGLHIVMKAPVWALLARIDLTGASTGFHRYLLVDQFLRRFGEWWLVGTRTVDAWGFDMWDTINSFVAAGTSGGLLNFALFVALFVVGFGLIGRRLRIASSDPLLCRELWAMGVLLFSYAVAFFGIAYFDQSQFVWYANLAMIAATLTLKPETRVPESSTIRRRASGGVSAPTPAISISQAG